MPFTCMYRYMQVNGMATYSITMTDFYNYPVILVDMYVVSLCWTLLVTKGAYRGIICLHNLPTPAYVTIVTVVPYGTSVYKVLQQHG